MAQAENMPAMTSQSGAPTIVGGAPGSPVTVIRPVAAWIMGSRAWRSRDGPVWPKPETLQ